MPALNYQWELKRFQVSDADPRRRPCFERSNLSSSILLVVNTYLAQLVAIMTSLHLFEYSCRRNDTSIGKNVTLEFDFFLRSSYCDNDTSSKISAKPFVAYSSCQYASSVVFIGLRGVQTGGGRDQVVCHHRRRFFRGRVRAAPSRVWRCRAPRCARTRKTTKRCTACRCRANR